MTGNAPRRRRRGAVIKGVNMSEGALYMLKLNIETWGMMGLITSILIAGFAMMTLSIFKKYKEWPSVAVLAMAMTILYFYMRWL